MDVLVVPGVERFDPETINELILSLKPELIALSLGIADWPEDQ